MSSYAAKLPRPLLVFVTPDNFSKDVTKAIALSKAVLDGGTSLIQIRDSNGLADDIGNVVDALLSAGIPAESLVINGMKPSDVLSMHPSLGIHIKENDIEEILHQVVTEMADRTNVVGCAVHTREAAEKAVGIMQPDYLQVGTMFPTTSHPGKIPEGPTLLQDIRQSVGTSPALVAIGGISNDNVATVMQHGADGIATISFLSGASDPSAAAMSILTATRQEYREYQRAKRRRTT